VTKQYLSVGEVLTPVPDEAPGLNEVKGFKFLNTVQGAFDDITYINAAPHELHPGAT
jgi:hypothetical protein